MTYFSVRVQLQDYDSNQRDLKEERERKMIRYNLAPHKSKKKIIIFLKCKLRYLQHVTTRAGNRKLIPILESDT